MGVTSTRAKPACKLFINSLLCGSCRIHQGKTEGGFRVKCGDTAIRIESVQLPDDLLGNGRPVEEGVIAAAVDEDLADVEEFLYDDEEDDDFDDDDFVQVTCPECNEDIFLDPDALDEDYIDCPACGTKLEFEFETEEDED